MHFDGFEAIDVDTPRGVVHARVGGSGPPLLLLHGWPQTQLMWHATAPALAERFTVVAADLPGYGASFRPEPSGRSRRALQTRAGRRPRRRDGELGHATFAVAGHDRGGRVGYRMALDHPGAVTHLAVLDIVPTAEVWSHADARFAFVYWHWGWLAQPAPLPERLIAGDPDAFWIVAERIGIKSGDPRFPDDVVAAYRAQLDDPAAIEAMCEDYRAGATVDRALDEADRGARTIDCPVRVLWGAAGALPLFYDDPLALWLPYAPAATGLGVDGAGHFLAEDEPAAVAEDLLAFLGR